MPVSRFFLGMNRLLIIMVICGTGTLHSNAQPPAKKDFLTFQKSFRRVSQAFETKEELLRKEFEAKKLEWPAKYIYLRSFKYDSELEVWVKSDKKAPYQLFKRYKVCALAGGLGPKRLEGDYQVPEGFYYLNEFRPNSNYHLALGVNYPNPSDRLLSDPQRPGGDIYVHGSCVTVGCIPLTDTYIEEVYVLAALARNQGQDFIPIHVMPVAFRREKSREFLNKFLESRPDYKPVSAMLEKVYFYFNAKRQLPNIMINGKGQYMMLEEFTVPVIKKVEVAKFRENTVQRQPGTRLAAFQETDFYATVNTHPKFPGGMTAFQHFIEQLSSELSAFIPEDGPKKMFIEVQYVVDARGYVVNVKPGDRVNNEMHNHIISRFESLPKWEPAIRQEKAVPMRLVQNLMVVAKEAPPKAPPPSEDDYE